MITYMFFVTWTVFLLIGFGAAFQFDFFLDNNFGTYFFLLELFGLTLVPLSFLVSTFLKKSSSASMFYCFHLVFLNSDRSLPPKQLAWASLFLWLDSSFS